MKRVAIVEIHGDKIQSVQKLLPFHYQERNNELILAAVEKKENNESILCGVLVVELNGFSSEVVHIEVEQAFRRQRVATQLLDFFIQLQFRIGEVWPITISYVDGADHQDYVAFIEQRRDFDLQYVCMIYHIQAEEREASEWYRKLRSITKQAELFTELPQITQNRFRQKMEAKRIPYLENVNFEDLEPSLSYCVQKNGEIVAAVLIQAVDEQELEICFAYADANHSLELAVASASAVKVIDAKYPKAVLTIVAVEAKAETFTKHLFPQCRSKEAIFKAVWNYNTIIRLKD